MVVAGDGIVGIPGDSHWVEANVLVAELRAELGRTEGAASRSAIEARLVEARQAVAAIEATWRDTTDADAFTVGDLLSAEAEDSGAIDDLLAELLVDDEIETQQADPEVLEEAITTARNRRFDQAGSPPLDRESGPRYRGQRRESSVGDQPTSAGPLADGASDGPRAGRTRGLMMVGAFVLSAGAGLAAFAAFGGDGEGDQEPVAASESPSPAGNLAELEEVLAIFGFDQLEVSQDGSVLYISGPVADADQAEVVEATARALVGDATLDTTGVTIARPHGGVSESSASITTESIEPALQRDLDRLLESTPVVFDRGATELAALDRRILNAVVALIRSAPSVNVTVVGRVGDAERGDMGLAMARATAVRDYLIDNGVDEDRVGVDTASATVDADRTGGIELRVDLDRSDP